MRYMMIAFALLLAATAVHAAEPRTPRGIVFAHECRQIDPKVTGFSCEFNDGRLTLVRHERFDQMDQERRENAEYEFNKITLRYFELGGTGFYIQADFWPSGRERLCSHVKNRPYYIYSCGDYMVKD